eukprot:6461619-Ditylum_brightwellii.AAC.1
MSVNMPIAAYPTANIGTQRRRNNLYVGTGADPMGVPQPQRAKFAQEACCDCMRHSMCSIASGPKACPCRQARHRCTTCRCRRNCRNRDHLDSTEDQAEGAMTAFFQCGLTQALTDTTPSQAL